MCHIRLHAYQLRRSLYKHIIWILKRNWSEAGCQGKTEDNKKKTFSIYVSKLETSCLHLTKSSAWNFSSLPQKKSETLSHLCLTQANQGSLMKSADGNKPRPGLVAYILLGFLLLALAYTLSFLMSPWRNWMKWLTEYFPPLSVWQQACNCSTLLVEASCGTTDTVFVILHLPGPS